MGSLDFQEIVSLGFWAFSAAVALMLVTLAVFMYAYYRKRLQAVVADGSTEAELASRVEKLGKDENMIREWLKDQKDELQRLAAERNDQELLRSELQRLEQECARNDDINRSLREEVGTLDNRKHLLTEKSQTLEKEVKDSEEKISQIKIQSEELVRQINQKTVESEERKTECEKLQVLQNQKQQELLEQEKQHKNLKQDMESIRFEHDSLRQKIESYKEREKEVDLINAKIAQLKQDLDDTRHGLTTQKQEQREVAALAQKHREEIENTKNKKAGIEGEIQSLGHVLGSRKNEFDNAEQRVAEIQNKLLDKRSEINEIDQKLVAKRFEKEKVEEVLGEAKSQINKLRIEEAGINSSIEALKVMARKYAKSLGLDGESEKGIKYRDLWQPVTFPPLSPADVIPTEQEMLQNTAKYIRSQNLYFPERVLHAFHTALKVNDISPLVVLAGISGTGKSELPRRYAEGMGMHSVILAVQPRWDSPQDLFGFYNYLEERYKATELARAMVQFEQYNRGDWPLPDKWNHERSDRMLLVLLDEMNLARVEYYFSEFLSRLETRRGIHLSNAEDRTKAEIALEMGSLTEGETPIRLFPGQNVLFSGTMNEDETTQALSDKVLDRSCVLRFGRPKQITVQENVKALAPAKNGLTYTQWESFLKSDLDSTEREQVNEWINKLNDAMEQLNRPFGHRVAQAIQRYIANYPSWVHNRVNLAMADQIEQRIMPKLRGIEIGNADQPLDEIQSVIQGCDDASLINAFKQGRQSQEQVFIWRGLDRTEDLF